MENNNNIKVNDSQQLFTILTGKSKKSGEPYYMIQLIIKKGKKTYNVGSPIFPDNSTTSVLQLLGLIPDDEPTNN